MRKQRAKVVHTIETLLARTVEVGECMEWTGYIQNGSPFVVSGGQRWLVRRLIRTLEGRAPRNGSHMGASCNNPRCVNPAHLLERSQLQHMTIIAAKVDHRHPIRVAKLQKAAAKRRKVTDEGLALIRADDRPCAAVALDFGVSKSLVAKIRSGQSNRMVNASVNPFAGLMR